tara:strand:- start:634 stop:1305 length:672 start_codon:yes stop_codon:yes gene_type:complete
MALPYFRYVPKFEYVSRLPDSKNIGDFIEVKNLFRRAKISDNLFQNINFFTKYSIVGDERPDNVAFKFYDEPYLDWLVLTANNIINLEDEWPLSQQSFYNYMVSKYGSETAFNNPHHYETIEIKDSLGNVILKKGLEVASDYSITYFDSGNNQMVINTNVTVMVTNYEYEDAIQNEKRNIFIAKPLYIAQILDDMEQGLLYKEGSTDYISDEVMRAANIRLYQ